MKVSTAGGKGSATRPFGVSKEQFDKNFEAIFGKSKKSQPQQDIQSKEQNHAKTK